MDDRRDLLHLVALGVVLADFLGVRDDAFEIDLAEIDEEVFLRHEKRLREAASPAAPTS
jgi:hypothetical protein